MPSIELSALDKTVFAAWEDRIMPLYLEAFSTGSYAGQYLDEWEERVWLRKLFSEHNACCYVMHAGAVLAGFLLGADAEYDKKLPAEMRAQLEGRSALAIAELAVATPYRQQGIASKLVEQCISDAKGRASNVIVRTNTCAKDACRLYERHGFRHWNTLLSHSLVRKNDGVERQPVEKTYYKLDLRKTQ